MGGAENRTSRNLFVRPQAQLRFCLLLSLGFLAVGGFSAYAMLAFKNHLEVLLATNQIDTQTIILVGGPLYANLRIIITVCLCFAVCGLALAVMLTHRIFGPVVPIRAHIQKLIAGDFESRVRLRAKDEFQDVAKDLNELAEHLSQKTKG